jgi:hypothetical protein
LRKGQWAKWLLGVVAGGLVLGAVAAAVSTPLRGTSRVVVTPLPGGAGGRAGGAGAAGAAADAAAPGAGAGAGAAQRGGAASAGPAAGGRQGAGPGGAGGGPRGAGAATGPRTNGVIVSLDGDTMMVNTPDGPVRVTLGDGTSVQKLAPAERTELTPGQRVTISGERAGDGAVAASGVQILGEQGEGPGGGGAGPGARGTRPGAGGGGQGATASGQEPSP